MSSSRIVRHIGALALGLMLAFSVAGRVGKSWPGAKIPVFLAIVAFWTAGAVQVIGQERRVEDAFENPTPTPPRDLPLEFRFITQDTTLQEIMDKVGPYSRETRSESAIGFEYDLPSGYAVLILPEPPFRPESKVRNVRMYLKTKERDSLV